MHTKALFTNPFTFYTEAFDSYESVTNQIDNITLINNNYDDISSNIVKHVSLKHELENTTKYRDFKGQYLAYTDKKKTGKEAVQDAVKEDIHAMLLQQNNAYIVGMIAISAVLITTFLVTKK